MIFRRTAFSFMCVAKLSGTVFSQKGISNDNAQRWVAESRLDQISSNFTHISSSLDVRGRNTENWKLGRSYREGNVGRSLARSHFGFEIGRDAPKIRALPPRT